MRPAAVIILLLTMASMLLTPASASEITIKFEKDQVKAKMVLSLHQNMTEFANQTISLDTSPGSNLTARFAEALKSADSAAKLSNLTLNLNSTRSWLNLTALITLSGVSEARGDILAVSTAWKAFNVSTDLRAGNFSYNLVGRRYLRPTVEFYVNASKFENNPNATVKAVTFFVNGTLSVTGEIAADQVGNFTVLDFRSLNVPLDQWTRTYNLTDHSTTWRYTPPPQLSASVKAQKLNVSFQILSDYSYSAEINFPGLARATGNTLLIDVGNGQKEWVMAGIVVLTIILAVAIQVFFRAKKKAVRLGRR